MAPSSRKEGMMTENCVLCPGICAPAAERPVSRNPSRLFGRRPRAAQREWRSRCAVAKVADFPKGGAQVAQTVSAEQSPQRRTGRRRLRAPGTVAGTGRFPTARYPVGRRPSRAARRAQGARRADSGAGRLTLRGAARSSRHRGCSAGWRGLSSGQGALRTRGRGAPGRRPRGTLAAPPRPRSAQREVLSHPTRLSAHRARRATALPSPRALQGKALLKSS